MSGQTLYESPYSDGSSDFDSDYHESEVPRQQQIQENQKWDWSKDRYYRNYNGEVDYPTNVAQQENRVKLVWMSNQLEEVF